MNYNIEELATIVSPIAKKYGVERVSLFGSRARGDNTEGSDYDFCIMPDKKMSLTWIQHPQLTSIAYANSNE